jgi:hypothetical protein
VRVALVATAVAVVAGCGATTPPSPDAMTTVPAHYWELPFAEIAVGSEATLLVLDRDPRIDVETLLTPRAVWVRGRRIR